ncbi:unnamed protein product [Fraxinus pennsylvanica]|uniref:Uncharacterized protein n=1 Tax=Fraxinus pennsylvanica TaxID=56036 RepID=A0AAD2EE07_9LAMI|nr:unnamed protein product [Fraxinus pennsylvanica]
MNIVQDPRVCRMNTVQDPDIFALYEAIRKNPEYLDAPNEVTFVESPLHTAASGGRTGLALEILRLKPSLGKKLNIDEHDPLNKASQYFPGRNNVGKWYYPFGQMCSLLGHN